MRYKTITVKPLTRTIGAEISGVDLSQPVSESQVKEIHDALMAHQVIFFRDQPIDHDQHKAFGRAFGDLALHSSVSGLPEHPEVVAIHADADSTFIAGDSWHSDLTINEEPPMGSILYLHTVPESGGDTMFASMYAAYEALSDRMQRYLEGLRAVHDGNPLYKRLFPDIDRTYPSATHPIIRTHPVTGRKLLFVNAQYTDHIVGVPKAESDAILNYLYDHCQDPRFHCRFRWEPHSIAFWDNRCTQHYAIWDYFPETRSGYRVTLAGDRPF